MVSGWKRIHMPCTYFPRNGAGFATLEAKARWFRGVPAGGNGRGRTMTVDKGLVGGGWGFGVWAWRQRVAHIVHFRVS